MRRSIVIIIICVLVQLTFAYEKESKCLAEKSTLLTIACPANKITRIIKAFYGYSWSGDCHFIEKDCVVDVPNDDLSCVGEGCSVRIIDSPIILQECWSLMASYIQVDYECISVEQLQNMCTVQESEFPVGYIVTPDYPSALKSELSCPCTLQAPAGYTITLEVLDFRMASCSQTGLTVWSDSSTYTHCSSISTGVLPGSGGQNISMRLHSQAERSNAGFLLKYFATPQDDNVNIKFVCYGSSQLWQTNTVDPKTAQLGSSIITAIPKKVEIETTKYTTKPTITKAGGESISTNSFTSDEPVLVETTTSSMFINHTSSNDSYLTMTSTENTKTFKMVDFKEDKFNDWTVIIISVVASVIFLLIMINALIWFIFSIKSDKKTMNKKLTNTIYSEHYYPQTQEYYKSALSTDDIYMSAAGGGGGGAPNNHPAGVNTNNSKGNTGKDALWKSAESLNAFTTHYLNNQAQIPTTTWPRMNTEVPNLMSASMPYGFNFEKAGGKKPKKYKLSKEEKKRIKEWEFLQELRLKKIKDDEMQHFLSSSADLTSSKYIIPNEYNHLKAGKAQQQYPKPQTNWPKYAKYNPNDRSNKDEENPAIIIDDDDRHAHANVKLKKHGKKVVDQSDKNQNNDYFDNMSRGGDESMIAFSDAVMLKSASQVPVNMQNPAYMYEEQEGSIDLRSEYSFYSKNAAPLPKKHHAGDNIMMTTNNMSNLNKKSHEETKAFCEYKDINSWKDVY